MKFRPWKKAALLSGVSLLCLLLSERAAAPQGPQALPSPVVVFAGPEFYEAGGKQWTRYRYVVENREAYSNTLFEPAPKLPPCGNNTNSSRTWVEIYDLSGKRLYGFCALGSRDGMANLWFAIERNQVPPSWVRIVITDRLTNTKTQSAPVETVE